MNKCICHNVEAIEVELWSGIIVERYENDSRNM